MKIISTLISVAAFASALSAFGQRSSETQTINYNGVDYDLETRWFDTKALNNYSFAKYPGNSAIRWGVAPSFIVKDDIIYFTKDADTNPSDRLLAVDGTTGKIIGVEPIDWGGVAHNDYAAVYAGTDSNGNYYVASFGAESVPDCPFEIFPLEINEGKLSVSNKYTLKMTKGTWIKSVDVFGDITSGDFSVTAAVSASRSPTDNYYKTGINIWNYAGANLVDMHYYSLNLTVSDLKMIDSDRVVIHDRHLWYSTAGTSFNIGNKAVAKDPTLYTFDTGSPIIHSTIIPSSGDDGYGNGVAFFSLGENNHFMVYASSGFSPEFKLLALPDFPESLDGAEEICILTPKSARLSADEPNSDRLKTGIFVEKESEYSANIFVTAHREGMAAYSISTEAPESSGVNNIMSGNDKTTEYYTVTGIKITGRPSAGLYIRKRGSEVRKILIK